MFGRLFLLLVFTFFAELSLLLWFAERFGWRMALAEVFLSGMAGALIVRRQTRAILQRQAGQRFADEAPTAAVLHGVLKVFAGFLLIAPGLITDVIGLLLLAPLFRKLMGLGVAVWIHRRFRMTSFGQGNSAATAYSEVEPQRQTPRIIDVKVIERPEDNQQDNN